MIKSYFFIDFYDYFCLQNKKMNLASKLFFGFFVVFLVGFGVFFCVCVVLFLLVCWCGFFVLLLFWVLFWVCL